MKVAHFSYFAPHTSGMYVTIAELIAAENKLGMDAGIIDTNNLAGGHTDDSTGDLIVSKDISWADDADIYVLSSTIPMDYKLKGKPIIMILHGCPRDIFESELFALDGKNAAPFSTMLSYFKQTDKFKAFVTLWKEHYAYYKDYVNNCYYVHAGCNLDKYKPGGKKYKFTVSGEPNIVFTEAWRFMKHPYHVLHGVSLAQRELPDLRFHLYGLPEKDKALWHGLCLTAGFDKFIGELDSIIFDLDDVYRAADMVITPVEVAHRIIREATASGTPIIAGGYEHTPYNFHPYKPTEMAEQIIRCWGDLQADPEGVKNRTRETAVKRMDVMDTARGLQKIYEKVLSEETR